jgi:hypothetical protein
VTHKPGLSIASCGINSDHEPMIMARTDLGRSTQHCRAIHHKGRSQPK